MSDRMRRVNEAVRAVVAEAVGELKDPRIGLVTVTGVSVSRDLREGIVYVAVLGNERKQRATLEGPRLGPRVPPGAGGPRAQAEKDSARSRLNTIRPWSAASA